MINENYLIVLDFETGSSSAFDPIPLEVAALVIDPRTLKRVPNATFETLIKPHCGWDGVQAKALEVNKLDKDEVDEKGVEEPVFFDLFTKFFKKVCQG